MKKIYLLIFFVVVLIIADGVLFYFYTENNKYYQCDSYDCLESKAMQGLPAKTIISEENKSMGYLEKSEIKVAPFNDKYEVRMKVLKLTKLEKYTNGATKGVFTDVGVSLPVSSGIINLDESIPQIEGQSAKCYTSSTSEAGRLVREGLSTQNIKKYNCKGGLVDIIEKINQEQVISDFSQDSGGVLVKKPAIYLYPLEKSEIKACLEIQGEITVSDPDYNSGWQVVADHDSLINDRYDYLFYEASLDNLELPEEGWVVEKQALAQWFDINLPKFGLNGKEILQFKQYWLEELNTAPYYEIKLLSQEFLTENMNLIIEPAPETLIRLNFHFQPQVNKKELAEPEINKINRRGFTVVEWGGILGN